MSGSQVFFGKKMWCLADFEIGMRIGYGEYGNVYLVREKRSELVAALKVIEKKKSVKQNAVDLIENEISVHIHLHHKNIISLYGYFWDDRYVYMIMEYARNESLYDMIKGKPTPEVQVKEWMRGVAEGIRYLHENKVIHRDIKPENILISYDKTPKLIDFGLAVHYPANPQRKTYCGTPPYTAPEVTGKDEYSYPADMWSFGLLIYEACAGYPPYQGSEDEILDHVLSGKLTFPEWMSEACQHLISNLVIADPKKRYTIDDVLKDPWFA